MKHKKVLLVVAVVIILAALFLTHPQIFSIMEGGCGPYLNSLTGLAPVGNQLPTPGTYKFRYSGPETQIVVDTTIPWDDIDELASSCTIDGVPGSFSKSICSYYKGSPVYGTVTIYEVICSGQGSGDAIIFNFVKETEPLTVCTTQLPSPCNGAVWVDYPGCIWDTSGCTEQPIIDFGGGIPAWFLIGFAIIIIIFLVIGIAIWRRR